MTASPLTTGLVITPGSVPGRVEPRMVHSPVTRAVVFAHSPLVTYSWRLKSPFGHVKVTVAVPLRDIATSNRSTPGTPAFEADTVPDRTVFGLGSFGLGSCTTRLEGRGDGADGMDPSQPANPCAATRKTRPIAILFAISVSSCVIAIDASASRQDQLMALRFALHTRSREARTAFVVLAHRGVQRAVINPALEGRGDRGRT